MLPQITCASALPGKTGKHENHIFHSNAVLVESAAAVGLCCTQCAVFLKEKLSFVMCLIVSTFVEIVSYPINTVHRLSLRLDEEQLRSFTQRPALTDLVNIEHEGNRQQDARSCLVHPLDHVDSEVWFSCNQVIF